jgi:glycine C-acetyltransferase/8-amino-7-oxononanoate synthase
MGSFKQDLAQITQAGLYRKLREISSTKGPRVIIDGKTVLLMASNDYLGFCSHPAIKKAAQDAISVWGTGAGASRLISGNISLFRELEKQLASLKKTEDALVFSTGYMANIGLLSAVGEAGDVIYSDELNHASIIDGCRMSRADVEIFPHKDTERLASLLKQGHQFRRRIIVTDGVFSMDGDLAPLPRLVELARNHAAMIIVDDAHATGVLGNRGGGTAEHFALEGKCDIVMGTLGKALGCFGAFVAGSRELRELLINRARPFIFTTALPPAVVASALEALSLLDKEPEWRKALWENVDFFKNGLQERGFNTLYSATPIIPIIVGEARQAVSISESLFQEGLFIQAIRPPTVPEGSSRLRVTITAAHTKEDLAWALEVLETVCKRHKVI